MLGPSAVAIVHTHHVKAGAESLFSSRYHVSRRGRALHTVPHHQRRMFRAILLPAAVGQHLTIGFDLKKPLFVARSITGPKRPEIGSERLRVTALENAMWNEGLGS